MAYTTRTTCRCCGSKNLTPLFSLGEQYVSDFVGYEEARLTQLREKMAKAVFKPILSDMVDKGILPQPSTPPVITWNEPRQKVPIDIELCNDCTLVQQKHTAPQDLLYTKRYWYRSGVTATMRNALRDVVDSACKLVKLDQGDVVLDIGSNDGTLLKAYDHTPSLTLVGVEPADNLATEDNYMRQGIYLIHDFWSYESWSRYMDVPGTLEHPPMKAKAMIVTAIGMMYDMEDPNQFVADVAKVLHPDGLFVIQLMCLRNMLEMGDVGNLCHEHLEFYSIRSLQHLLNKHGLSIVDIETNNVNGQSYRIYIRHKTFYSGGIPNGCAKRVLTVFGNERRDHDPEFLKDILTSWNCNRHQCFGFVQNAVSQGKKVWVYGASTKGNVMLQWWGLDSNLITAAADRSPEKWGKYTVGTGIPIKSEEDFRKANPEYALVLPWPFLPEFIEREKEWRAKGGKFIVACPYFKVV